MDQVLSKARSSQTYTPAEHVVGDNGKQYRERHGKNALGRGWQSFGSVIQLECQSDGWFFRGRLRRPEADRPKVAMGMRGDRRLARSCVGQRVHHRQSEHGTGSGGPAARQQHLAEPGIGSGFQATLAGDPTSHLDLPTGGRFWPIPAPFGFSRILRYRF